MKKIVKNLLCVFVIIALALSIVACSSNEANSSGDDPKLVEYVAKEGDAFVDGFESSFEASSGGLTCECSIDVDGTTIVIDCLMNDVDDLPNEVKEQMQMAYDETKDILVESFKLIKDEAPTLTGVILNICEEDGDTIAKVELDF